MVTRTPDARAVNPFDRGPSRTEQLAAAGVLGRYRKLILLGRLRVPLDAARRLVGPDCAYRLYGRVTPRKKRTRRRKRRHLPSP